MPSRRTLQKKATKPATRMVSNLASRQKLEAPEVETLGIPLWTHTALIDNGFDVVGTISPKEKRQTLDDGAILFSDVSSENPSADTLGLFHPVLSELLTDPDGPPPMPKSFRSTVVASIRKYLDSEKTPTKKYTVIRTLIGHFTWKFPAKRSGAGRFTVYAQV